MILDTVIYSEKKVWNQQHGIKFYLKGGVTTLRMSLTATQLFEQIMTKLQQLNMPTETLKSKVLHGHNQHNQILDTASKIIPLTIQKIIQAPNQIRIPISCAKFWLSEISAATQTLFFSQPNNYFLYITIPGVSRPIKNSLLLLIAIFVIAYYS